MKIIDKEGKVFGRINIIDIAIILIVVALAVGVGYKLFVQKDASISATERVEKEAEVVFSFSAVPVGSEEAIQVGDKVYFDNRKTDAEVVAVEIKDMPAVYLNENKGVSILDNSLYKQVTVTVKMKVTVADDVASFKGEVLKVNKEFEFETAKFTGEADIIRISYDK